MVTLLTLNMMLLARDVILSMEMSSAQWLDVVPKTPQAKMKFEL